MFLSDLMAIEPPVVIYQKDGVELHLNGVRSGKQLLSSYIQFISNNYSIEELRDCLEYSGFAYNRNQA